MNTNYKLSMVPAIIMNTQKLWKRVYLQDNFNSQISSEGLKKRKRELSGRKQDRKVHTLKPPAVPAFMIRSGLNAWIEE